MFARLPTRRALAASAVILFHLLLIFALIRVTTFPIGLPNLREIPIMLYFQPLMQKTPMLPKHNASPPVPPVDRSIYLPLLPPVPAVPPPTLVKPEETNGLRALGRYLYNCSGAYYEQLSEREWAHCLGNLWGSDLPAKQRAPVLDAPKPSPFDIVITERKKPAVPIEHACKLGQMNSNLGLPCYTFPGD
ncbi:MAG TPA: hypothetical protein VGT78_08185 [Rhizomicrobium sp.]|nr:hypothetical protein [Rhizomicrobium sp.]